jgi:integrase
MPVTFGELAHALIAILQPGWRSRSHHEAVNLLLLRYAAPLANKYIDEITADDVEACVRASPQQDRLLRAIREVFKLAISRGLRFDNPASHDIMKYRIRNGKKTTVNFKAMPYTEVSAFIQRLRPLQPTILSTRVIEFLILTACREDEAAGMLWSEVNFETKVWTISAERTKTEHDHRVPLSNRAVELLKHQPRYDFRALRALGEKYHQLFSDCVWSTYPGTSIGAKALYLQLTRYMKVPYTIHGFRASFSSWCYDEKHYPEELVEKCLAHQSSKVISAYRRTDALERRREIMEKWADYCGGELKHDR